MTKNKMFDWEKEAVGDCILTLTGSKIQPSSEKCAWLLSIQSENNPKNPKRFTIELKKTI